MAAVFTLAILVGAILIGIGMKNPMLNRLVKYGVLLFIIGFSSAIANSLETNIIAIFFMWGVIISLYLLILGLEDPRVFTRNNQIPKRGKIAGYTLLGFVISLSLMISTCSSSVSNAVDSQQSNQPTNSESAFKPIVISEEQSSDIKNEASSEAKLATTIDTTETQDVNTSEFDWEAFEASPAMSELYDNVGKMQKNRLIGANFLPYNYKNTGLGDFMKAHNLKFSDVSLDCFSSDTECKLHVHITRQEYTSKVDGYICGAVAYWTAPFTNLKQWTPHEGMALPPLLYEGNVNAVLRKIDYEHERRC